MRSINRSTSLSQSLTDNIVSVCSTVSVTAWWTHTQCLQWWPSIQRIHWAGMRWSLELLELSSRVQHIVSDCCTATVLRCAVVSCDEELEVSSVFSLHRMRYRANDHVVVETVRPVMQCQTTHSGPWCSVSGPWCSVRPHTVAHDAVSHHTQWSVMECHTVAHDAVSHSGPWCSVRPHTVAHDAVSDHTQFLVVKCTF